MLRSTREDSLRFIYDTFVSFTQAFITRNLDKSFVEPPPFDLGASFSDSSPKIPLVFLLSAGSDPTASLFMFAKQRGMYEK